MRCFRCAKEIVVPPKDDPIYNTIPAGQDRCYYFPATVLEVLKDHTDCCNCAVVCWDCFIEIDPDMWISDEGWDGLNPAVPFSKLPVLDHDAENAGEIEVYKDYAPKEERR